MIVAIFIIIALFSWSSAQTDVPRPKKKHNQEVKVKADVKPVSKAHGILANAKSNDDILANLNTFTINLPTDTPTSSAKESVEPSACPPCAGSNKIKLAMESFWNNDLLTAYACACNQLLAKKEDGFAQAILYQLSQAKHQRLEQISSATKKVDPPSKDPSGIKTWEILGPINVGKLEMDADPTFTAMPYDSTSMDIGSYLLSMPSNATVHSELIQEGKVQWQTVHAKKPGDVDVHFSVSWNELAQAMGTAAVYEFQGWARANTYVKAAGSYIISCQGVHSIYVRNDNQTRVLVGDVYRSNQVHASVDLKVGLVGLILPLRGQGQSNFYCQVIPPTGASILVHPPKQVPDLLELSQPGHPQGKGLLLSSLFSLPVQNLLGYPITVKLSVEKPVGEVGDFVVREASLQQTSDSLVIPSAAFGGMPDVIQLAPGLTTVLSLELISVDPKNKSRILPEVYLNCQKNRGFSVTLTPSIGPVAKASVEFPCRRQDQSFSISFLDHDGTVSHAAIILPQVHFNAKQRNVDSEYPFLLTMHGSGISAASNADAYKMMPKGKKDYTFGVEGFFVVSPSRFGAHNWESVGELTVLTSVRAARQLFASLEPKLGLPRISSAAGILAGHSMGGHGAWLTAVDSPDLFNCVSPGSGWIKKEEYATANAFFYLDIHNSYVDDKLKGLLEKAMSEYHVDKLVSNLQSMQVHTRVGSVDYTTHPWYSRRMHRLLLQRGVDSTLEEVLGKQHWWWDTEKDNDGGVVNDPKMRDFYARCLARSNQDKQLRLDYLQYLNSSSADNDKPNFAKDWLSLVESKNDGNTIEVDVSGSTRSSAKPKAAAKDKDADAVTVNRRCNRNISVTLVNPSAHSGLCGVRVSQQHHSLTRSHVDVQCGLVTEQERVGSVVKTIIARRCEVIAANVRRLEMSFGFDSVLFVADELLIDGVLLDVRDQPGSSDQKMELCWTNAAFAGVCSKEPVHPLLQKSLVNAGPVRQVYSRPFFIVYGSPQNQALRSALRDLAVYLGNAHYSAHYTHVKVLSDLDYISGGYAKREVYSNIVFIGGPTVNKLLKLMSTNAQSTASVLFSSETLSSQCLLPGNASFIVDDKDSSSFSVASQSFYKADQAAIFTLPLYRPSLSVLKGPEQRSATVAMGVVIHANSVQGYLHMSRVAWSVVPPMVRAPFANYIPDFMVIDSSVWSHGFGGVLAAGYWDAEWRVDESQVFINEYALKKK